MIRFVLDTNIVISAHLLPLSVSRKAYDRVMDSGIVLCSAELLSELTQTFARPKFDKYISLDHRMKAIALFEKKTFITAVNIKINACRDPKDNKLLELAISGNASYIITGDNDLIVLHPFNNINIVTPSTFLSTF